jgi:hypothetical protein
MRPGIPLDIVTGRDARRRAQTLAVQLLGDPRSVAQPATSIMIPSVMSDDAFVPIDHFAAPREPLAPRPPGR